MSRPALLAAGTELHLLVLENDRASCQAWTVEHDPVQERELWLVRRRQHQDRTLEVRATALPPTRACAGSSPS